MSLIIKDIGAYRSSLNPLLRKALAGAEEEIDLRKRLNVSLALLPEDPEQVEYLYERVLDADPGNVVAIVEALKPHKDRIKAQLWALVQEEKSETQQHLRTAAALAAFDGSSPRWASISKRVVKDLVRENPVYLGSWLKAFDPVKKSCFEPLLEVLKHNTEFSATERNIASNLLLNYAQEEPGVLAEALLESDEVQFPRFLEAVRDRHAAGLPFLISQISSSLDGIQDAALKERQANRMANAGLSLMMLGDREHVWGLLKHSQDSRVRSYLISRIGRLGTDPAPIADRLGITSNKQALVETDLTVRRALVQTLGMFPETVLTKAHREKWLPRIQELYRESPDPGLHSSAEWLLRQWNQEEWLRQTVTRGPSTRNNGPGNNTSSRVLQRVSKVLDRSGLSTVKGTR